jgi:hypothetical protein
VKLTTTRKSHAAFRLLASSIAPLFMILVGITTGPNGIATTAILPEFFVPATSALPGHRSPALYGDNVIQWTNSYANENPPRISPGGSSSLAPICYQYIRGKAEISHPINMLMADVYVFCMNGR